jgi:hypothetical protein
MNIRKSILISGMVALGLLLSTSVGQARNPPISSWIKNLSYTDVLEPAGAFWEDQYSNLAVVGKTVHTLWYGRKNDWSDERFVYARSTNNGSSWDAARVIASGSDLAGSTFRNQGASNQYLCVSGATVHIVIPRYVPGWHYGLYYYRSTDNGATFEPARALIVGADAWHITQPRIACNPQRVVIGYTYWANWYANYHINLLISEDGGAQFRGSPAVGSEDHDGNFEDLALSGTDIYVLYYHLTEPYSYGYFQAQIGLASSIDDGHSFRSQVLTTAATDGRYYALGTKDDYNSPDLAVVGSTVHVIWSQRDTNFKGVNTLMYSRSANKGASFAAPRVLFKADILAPGQETIKAQGNHVYVLFPTTDSKIKLRRSVDQGRSFLAVQNLSNTGGWWPELGIDPRDKTGASVYAFYDAPTLRHSIDGGETFTKALWSHPIFSYNRIYRSQLVVGADGVLHTTSNGFFSSGSLCNGICDGDTFYRRIAPPPAPSVTARGLRLETTVGANEVDRADNFQAVAQTVGFTNAMTAEVWVRDMGGGIGTGFTDYRKPIIFKQRELSAGYRPAYGLGTLDYYGQRKIFADLHTSQGTYSISAPGSDGLLTPKVWTHLALTYDAKQSADNFMLFRNGMLIAKGTASGVISAGVGNLWVGRYGNWIVDELRLWQRALTTAEIQANMTHALIGNESGLSAYYNFNNTIRDLTGHGNDGLLMYKEKYATGKF